MWTGQQHFFRPKPRAQQDCLLPTNGSVLSEDMQIQWKSQGRLAQRCKQETGAEPACSLPTEFRTPPPTRMSPLLEV